MQLGELPPVHPAKLRRGNWKKLAHHLADCLHFEQKNAPCTRALTLLPLKRTSEDAGAERRDYGGVDSLRTFIFGDPQRNATKIRARIDCLLALNRN